MPELVRQANEEAAMEEAGLLKPINTQVKRPFLAMPAHTIKHLKTATNNNKENKVATAKADEAKAAKAKAEARLLDKLIKAKAKAQPS